MHTYRILTSHTPPAKISRIYLFYNGLNELDRMGLYYQLASEIIASAKADANPDTPADVACILRPFPGHLTRARFAQFAEEPLHRYLWDGSYLFSQFLRHMIETQWFVSAIVRRSRYRSPSGAELLAESENPGKHSRLDSTFLVKEITKQWEQLNGASTKAIDLARQADEEAEGFKDRPSEAFGAAIDSLRNVLKLDEWPDLGGELTNNGYDEEPSLHVVGYSLGGFSAQAVFMSWPFVISSCSTLLSGGALRELSPTAFAHAEEWQTVLHSLRYELDEGMLNGRYQLGDGQLAAGMDRELFHHFQRTFYEVFEQEYRGSYETRVEAFRQRMLFIVGGDDPIVRPNSVLDSAPAGGVNLLEIGGLGHFIGGNPRGDEERQQRRFWLPEVGRLVARFSLEATARHWEQRADNWLNKGLNVGSQRHDRRNEPNPKIMAPHQRRDAIVKLMSDRERLELPGDGALASSQFASCLNDLLARQHGDVHHSGYLLLLRNEIPTILLPTRAIQRRARALYHDDRHIIEYCREVAARAEAFEDMTHTVMIIPWNAYKVMKHLVSRVVSFLLKSGMLWYAKNWTAQAGVGVD